MAEVFVGPDVTGDFIADADITPSGSFVTIGGVTFTDSANVGSGTGGYNTFLAIQDDNDAGDAEEGFNSETEGADNHELKSFTHVVLLSDLVITTINGVQYYEFRMDLNEANSDPDAQLSLDQFKLFTSTDGTIVDRADLFGENLIYNMDAGGDVSVLLSDAESTGSGTDDYAVLVPVSNFAGVVDPTTTYVYLYTEMGAAGADWGATSTFEEWNLQNGVALTGLKFNDLNANGIQDAGEDGVAGVTIFIDSNQSGDFDVGERTTVTDVNGNYTFFGVALNQTVWIDEIIPAGATQTTGAHEEVIIPSNAEGSIVVDPIGNHYPVPDVHLEKDATVPGGTADTAGELISYTLAVSNPGEVALTGIVITDPYADAGSIQAVLSGGFNVGDADQDNQLDLTETWQYTATHTVTQAEIDSNGGGDGELENTATVNTDQGVTDDDDASVPIDQNPALNVTKAVTSITGGQGLDGLTGADSDGDVINYAITVQNTGNVTLTGLTVTDPNADPGSIQEVLSGGFNTGDADTDGVFDVGETWNFTATHTVTQAELDGQGIDNAGVIDGDGDDDNTVTADSNETGPDTADAFAPLIYNPLIDLEKYVAVDSTDGTDGTFVDADDALGPQNVNLGADVWFKVTVQNTGNVTLTDIDISDVNQTGGGSVNFDLMQDGALTVDAVSNHSATIGGDDGDGVLDVGETWTITYRQAFDPGEHVNTATVTTDEGPTDSDAAHYFSLVDTGLCPRTPGFWQNMNNGGLFWDGVQGNEKHAGESGFPDGELLYAVDSDNSGSIGAGDVAGLLIGDYNYNGLTDVGEDTLFVSYTDALKLINASNKQLNGLSGDGKFMLGRDMVASWLNNLQGSGFGDASDPESPHHYLDDAIDWMQIFSGTLNGGTTETFDTFKLAGAAIKTSSATWNSPQSGIDHSASEMHSALDYYNNTGQTEPGGTHYANCESQHLFEALDIYQQSHELI